MLIAPDQPLPFIKNYVEQLDNGLKKQSGEGLSVVQKAWLGFCLMGILITNSICWSRYERASFGRYRFSALSWMFRNARICWAKLLPGSVRLILDSHGITHGVLVGDESDRARCKGVKQIHKAHKLKDKKSGGYTMGQSVVLLLLVSPIITIPVNFAFYQPDPRIKAWDKEDRRLKARGVAKKDRPAKPNRDPRYPTKAALLFELLVQFQSHFPDIEIKAILADALYGNKAFMKPVSQLFGGVQVVSQLRSNQLVHSRGKWISLCTYFKRHGGVVQTLHIRGAKAPTTVTVGAARLGVKAHGCKCFVIALKYEGETNYRYLVATDLSWRHLDIVRVYTLRWLVGVSGEGHITQSVQVRPRSKDSDLVAWEASWRESKTVEPSDPYTLGCTATHQVVTCSERRGSLVTRIPVAETVDNARKQQGPIETSLKRRSSPAGYQRRHGAKGHVSTGEALGVRRGKLVEEVCSITVSGKWMRRHQGGGSGRITVDRCAAKRARREGPGPGGISFIQSEVGVR